MYQGISDSHNAEAPVRCLNEKEQKAAAKAFGIESFTVSKSEDILPTLKKAVELHAPVVIDFHISPDANVLPMIPPGKDVDDIILELK